MNHSVAASELADFMAGQANSRSREAILRHRLICDLQVAAATRGYFLEVYSAEVDQDGFDLIIDDRDVLKKLQVKSLGFASTTKRLSQKAPASARTQGFGLDLAPFEIVSKAWPVHKAILRPRWPCAEELGFEQSPEGVGEQGGVVLIRFRCVERSLHVEYLFTDVFVITAFRLGLLSHRATASNASIKKLCLKLSRGPSHEQVTVGRAAFVRARSPEHLLALAGIHSRFTCNWINNLVKVAEYPHNKGVAIQSDKEERSLRSHVAHNLRELIRQNTRWSDTTLKLNFYDLRRRRGRA